MTDVTITSCITSISYCAFSGCTRLMDATIQNGASNIGASAFSGCKNLTGINIPESVSVIGIDTFDGCSKLTSISADATNTNRLKRKSSILVGWRLFTNQFVRSTFSVAEITKGSCGGIYYMTPFRLIFEESVETLPQFHRYLCRINVL